MISQTLPKITKNITPLFHRRQPTLSEMAGILDLLPQAAILLDMKTKQVLLANSKATELTAFTRVELAQMSIDTLFGNFPNDDEITTFISPVSTRNGTSIDVFTTLNHLDATNSWLLAALIPAEEYHIQQSEIKRLAHRKDETHAMISAIQEPDLHEAVLTALKACQNLTGASILAVFLVDPHNPCIKCTESLGDWQQLPDQINPQEVSSILQTSLWLPGKRTRNVLQRAARVRNLPYLASAPIGQSSSFLGFVIMADAQSTPTENDLLSLQLLADILTNIIQHHSLITNLFDIQRHQEHLIAIGETVNEVIQDGVIQVGNDLTIEKMNPSAEWTLGYATREVYKHPIENILIGAENLIPALQSALNGRPTYSLGNVHLHRRDGDTFLAYVRTIPLTINDRVEGVIILIHDQSEHEQNQILNQQLEQQAFLTEFTAIFAHEIRNPINNISTTVQLMAINLPANESNQDSINRIEHECTRLTQLMQSILAYSRPIENKIEPVDLVGLIDKLLERWRPRMAKVRVQHSLTHAVQNHGIMGTPRTLEQVFANLINNAVEAMSAKGGTLAVNIRFVAPPGEREQLEVSVSDNGPGIPDEIRERIFEPFFTTNTNGNGLGLAIAKRIVTTHKGVIKVASVPGGTVFQVILPAIIL